MGKKIVTLAGAGLLALSGCAGVTASGSTPQACIEALEAANEIMGVSTQAISSSGEIVGALPEALIAASNNDAQGLREFSDVLTEQTQMITGLSTIVEESDYPELAEECKAGV